MGYIYNSRWREGQFLKCIPKCSMRACVLQKFVNEATMDSPLEAIWVRILLKDVKDGDGVTLSIFGCYDRALAEMSKY